MVTTERILESKACSELWILLKAIGEENPIVDRIGIWGLIAAKTSIDPVDSVIKMVKEIRENPTKYNSLFRVLPIQKIVQTSIENIVEASKEYSTKINPEESFRITFEKRRSKLSSRTVIDAVAEEFQQKVDLTNPDWVVLIEILGRITGISLIHSSEILNIQKERAKALFADKEN
ncbi:THUMP domain-containing protein [Candidatus Bathyarchaeota archaeon]|nr:THUMP domain-containing protein [Candidatus Bathyarchaeota archaeon]